MVIKNYLVRVIYLEFDWAEFKEKVKKYAYIIGIDKIGFTDGRPFTEHLPILQKRLEEGYVYAINEGEPSKRINPAAHLKGVKSIISVAVCYPARHLEDEKYAHNSTYGRVSFISRGKDYHHIIEDMLQKLSAYIKENSPIPAESVLMVDTGELLEKAVSARAGLGWIGKHTLLVTPEFGSWVCLGEMITNLPFPRDEAVRHSCGNCTICVEACPTKALDGMGNLNPDRCLASITQTKKTLPQELRPLMKNYIYGCDVCQKACPYNRKAKQTYLTECNYDINDAYPSLKELLTMSRQEFNRRFGHTSGAWRGRTVWQRNALIAAGNLQNEELVPYICDLLINDPRVQIRIAAAWALGRIRNEKAISALHTAKEKEKNEQVMEEINLAIQK